MANILLVDDEVAILSLMEGLLRLEDHSVTRAENGREALLKMKGTEFDLIVTDLVMPEKEGLETIMEIRKENPSVKVIAMSGGGFVNASEYLALASAFGVSATLMKPFSKDELLRAVATALETRERSKESPQTAPGLRSFCAS